MAELNHNTIKDAIVAELKTNAALFTSTAEANKVRAITTGKPEDILVDPMYPYIIVTNGRPLESIEQEDFILSDAVKYLEHIIRYNIIVVTLDKDSRAAEKELDDYTELILETMQLDRDINGNVDTSQFVAMDDLDTITTDTTGKRGRVLTFECIKATGA